VAISTGCTDPDKITMSIDSPETMAAETTYKARVDNTCSGTKFGGVCNGATVTSIDSMQVADESVASVTPLAVEDNGLIYFELRALKAGSTTISVKATFSVGSVVSGSKGLRVVAVDEVRVTFPACRADANAPELVQQGKTIGFEAQLFGGSRQLAGSAPNFVEAEGVQDVPDGLSTTFEFTAPLRDAQIPLESRFVNDVGVTFESFGPERITAIVADSPDSTKALKKGQGFYLKAHAQVGNRIPCDVGSAQTTTLTPLVCLGPQDDEVWQTESADTFYASAVGSGLCRLHIALDGSTLETDIDVSLDVND
jgi:hypothetical protein